MRKKFSILPICCSLILCSFLLTACSDDEWDLMAEFFRVWAEEKGLIVDGEIRLDKIAVTAAQDSIDNILNSEKNTQLEGLDVIRDIERAEELTTEAMQKLDPDLMELPKEIRPNDWIIQEQDAVIWGAKNNPAAAQSAITESDRLLRKSLEKGGSCLSARRAQLETRLEITWDEIMKLEGGPGRTPTAVALREIHTSTRSELQAINHRQYSSFCSEK